MKYAKTKFAVAALAMSITSVNAATISDNSIVVNILKDGLPGQSMLIDTQIFSGDIVNGTLSSWTSNSDLTAAISGFITGASSVEFWVAGRYIEGANKYALSGVQFDASATVNGFVDANIPAYISDSNIGLFSGATEGVTENWVTDIPAGDPSHFQNANTNGLVASVGLGVDGAFIGSQSGFFIGVNNFDYNTWRLDADGTLSYGVSAVPVPAAVWLFGSGLIGLVGVARRRKS